MAANVRASGPGSWGSGHLQTSLSFVRSGNGRNRVGHKNPDQGPLSSKKSARVFNGPSRRRAASPHSSRTLLARPPILAVRSGARIAAAVGSATGGSRVAYPRAIAGESASPSLPVGQRDGHRSPRQQEAPGRRPLAQGAAASRESPGTARARRPCLHLVRCRQAQASRVQGASARTYPRNSCSKPSTEWRSALRRPRSSGNTSSQTPSPKRGGIFACGLLAAAPHLFGKREAAPEPTGSNRGNSTPPSRARE